MKDKNISKENPAMYLLAVLSVIFSSIGLGSILSTSISIFALIKSTMPEETFMSLFATLYGGVYFVLPAVIMGIIIWTKQRKNKDSILDSVKKINKINWVIILIAFIVLIIMTIILVKKISLLGGSL